MYPKHDNKNSKCFVYFFTFFVVLCSIALVFATLVLRVKNPALIIDSISIKSLHFDNPSLFNVTLLMKISISNRNFGHFVFDDDQRYNSVSLGYGGGYNTVGRSKLRFGSDRVASRGEESVGIDMKVNSASVMQLGSRVYEDLNDGLLDFVGFSKLKGKVYVLKNRVILSTVSDMNCSFQIDLAHKAVHKLQC